MRCDLTGKISLMPHQIHTYIAVRQFRLACLFNHGFS